MIIHNQCLCGGMRNVFSVSYQLRVTEAIDSTFEVDIHSTVHFVERKHRSKALADNKRSNEMTTRKQSNSSVIRVIAIVIESKAQTMRKTSIKLS